MYYSALIGNPTHHSVSHVMFPELARMAGVKDDYGHLKIDLEEAEIAPALAAFKRLHFIGLNVTLPHKLAIMPQLDEIDDSARELGAVNTVKLGDKTIGFNTDWVGLCEPVKKICSGNIGTVTVFGSGGAARAAIYAAKQLGANRIVVLYRQESHDQKTEDLLAHANELGIDAYEYTDVTRCVGTADLIINATSAGMVGHDPVPFDLKLLQDVEVHDKIFFDAVFNPLETPLIQYFKTHGAHTIDGLWMMIYQGIAALSIWLDHTISVTDGDLVKLHNLLEKEL